MLVQKDLLVGDDVFQVFEAVHMSTRCHQVILDSTNLFGTGDKIISVLFRLIGGQISVQNLVSIGRPRASKI